MRCRERRVLLAVLARTRAATSSGAPPAMPRSYLAAASVAPALAWLAFAAGGCTSTSAPTGAGSAAAPPSGLGCEAAALRLAPDAVIAVVDGKSVTAKELPPELARAEREALHSYCNAIANFRKRALEDAVETTLVAKASGGQPAEKWLDEQVAKEAGAAPTEEALKAFYEAEKPDDAPSWADIDKDLVRETYEKIQKRKARAAIISRLRNTAKVDVKLPDVAPPAVKVVLPAHVPTVGPADAKVTVLEFADFQCPYCARGAQVLTSLKAKFAGKSVRFGFINFPLESIHPQARAAAEHAQCANKQGKFWGVHDIFFANQGELTGSLPALAGRGGAALAELDACMKSSATKAEVDAQLKLGDELGVTGTPTFVVDGRKIEEWSPDQLEQLISDALSR